MLVLLLTALRYILRGDLFYVLLCVILFLCFSVLLALRLARLGKRELILVLFVRLFGLRVFGFVCFHFLSVSGKGCGSELALPGCFSYVILSFSEIVLRYCGISWVPSFIFFSYCSAFFFFIVCCYSCLFLTFVMPSKLRCHAHFKFPANQVTLSGFLIVNHIFNDKQCRARSVANWSGYTLLLRQGMSCSAREGLVPREVFGRENYISHTVDKSSRWHLMPMKTEISLSIRAVWVLTNSFVS